MLKALLEAMNISVFMSDNEFGQSIAESVAKAIGDCDLLVVLGTETYGEDTDGNCGTLAEMRYFIDRRKPFFLVKMCEKFKHAETRFNFPSQVLHFPWELVKPMPPELPIRIRDKLKDILAPIRQEQDFP